MSDPVSSCTLVNSVSNSANLCTGEIEYDFYNCNVHKWTAVLFVALFGLSTLLHLIQGIRSRRWYLLATVFLCGLTETLGWSGRLWSAVSTEWSPTMGGVWMSNETAFLMQISSLIAPAFLAAGWYITLGYLIGLLGPQYCRFTPRFYSITFVLGDVASLIIQGVGGGMAAGAETSSEADQGANVMLGGIFMQLVIMVLYSFLLAEFVWRYFADKPVSPLRIWKTKAAQAVPRDAISPRNLKKSRTLILAMVFSTVLIFIRSIYRVIELLEGWNGPIISNEMLFCVLDGLMVLLATATFNVIHPLWFLPQNNNGHANNGVEGKDGLVAFKAPSLDGEATTTRVSPV